MIPTRICNGYVKNTGYIDVDVDYIYGYRDEYNSHNEEIPSKHFIRIPELDLEGFIEFDIGLSGFSLTEESKNFLTNNGKYEMFINILSEGEDCDNSKTRSVKHSYLKYKDFGYRDWDMNGRGFLFVLLDEFHREFSAIQYTYSMNLNSEKLEEKMKSDIGNLDKDLRSADVTLKCKDRSLKAHKHILIARSEFFERMFSHETQETKTNTIQCNFDFKVMKSVRDYIYKGKVDESMLHELYEAGDYYDFSDLKRLCEKMLMQRLTSSNVISELKFAEIFSAPNLLNKALVCITWNAEIVRKDRAYLELKETGTREKKLLSLINKALATPK